MLVLPIPKRYRSLINKKRIQSYQIVLAVVLLVLLTIAATGDVNDLFLRNAKTRVLSLYNFGSVSPRDFLRIFLDS